VDHIVVVNLESQVQAISYEDLAARLIDEEKRVIGNGVQDAEKVELKDLNVVAANIAKSRGSCYSCGKHGHNAAQCSEKEESERCEWCGRLGHEEEICRIKEYQKKKGKGPKALTADAYDGVSAYSAIFG